MSYWISSGCLSCEFETNLKRACSYYEAVGEGYEAGFEAAMRSLVKVHRRDPARLRPYFFLMVNDRLLRQDGHWGNGQARCFDTAAEAQAAIATAPHWWPKQPWEVE